MFRRSSKTDETTSEQPVATLDAPLSPDAPPEPEARLPKGVYNNFAFEFTNAIMWQSFGSPVILFIRQSGASVFVVGALSAIQFFLMPLTLFFSDSVERLGYRRTALTCWTLRWLFCSS